MISAYSFALKLIWHKNYDVLGNMIAMLLQIKKAWMCEIEFQKDIVEEVNS